MAAYNTTDLTTFIATVRADLGPAAFWTDSEITKFINAGLRTWNCLTGFWAGNVTFPTIANRPYYPLPNTTLVFGARVELDGQPLQQGTLFGWDQQNPQWMSDRGEPEQWAPVGIAIIAMNPIPPNGGQSLKVYGTSVTPVLVNPGDFINIGREDFNALTDYIAHTLQVKSGGMELQTSIPAYKAFIAAAGVRNEKLRATTFYRKLLGNEQDRQLKMIRRLLQPVTKDASNEVGMR